MTKRAWFAAGFALSLFLAGRGAAAERRLTVPRPVLFMYGYSDSTRINSAVWGSLDRYHGVWSRTIEVFDVIDGVTQDAELVKRLREQGKVFAFHVSNTIDERHQTVEDFVAAWSQPFENTLGGMLAGGFDAICIDEFHAYPDGTKESRMQGEALRLTRERYPDRLIFASGVWKLADGGRSLRNLGEKITYDDTLNAVAEYADILLLENYQTTGNPQLDMFESMADNVSRRCPALLKKTVFVLYISQSAPFIANNDPDVDFFKFLETQVKIVRSLCAKYQIAGVGYWVFYRSKPDTIEKIMRFTEDYFNRTGVGQ